MSGMTDTNWAMTRCRSIRVARAAAALVALVIVAGACADTGEQVTTTGSPGGRDDALFVSIEVGGGFVPPGSDFRQAPVAVYSDGQAFAGGAITLQFPGPAVLPVIRSEVTPAQLDELLAAAEAAGLAGDKRDYGEPGVLDASTTTITVVADGQTHVTSIYALGHESSPKGDNGGSGGRGLTAEQREARRQAQEFAELTGSRATAGPGKHYEPERYRVLPLDPDSNTPAPADDTGIEPDGRDWPFPHIALEPNRCAVVTGADAAEFTRELQQANELTRWRTSSGEAYPLAVRPVLPHEPDCPPEPE